MTLTVPCDRFIWLHQVVRPFCDTRDIRPVQASIYLRAADGRLTLEATDSYTAARAWHELPTEGEFSALVDAHHLRTVVKALRRCTIKDVFLERTDGALVVTAGWMRFELETLAEPWPLAVHKVLEPVEPKPLTEPVAFTPSLLARLDRLPIWGTPAVMTFSGAREAIHITWPANRDRPGYPVHVAVMPAKLEPPTEAVGE